MGKTMTPTPWQKYCLNAHLHNHKDDAVHIASCSICAKQKDDEEMHARLTMCPTDETREILRRKKCQSE